MEGREGRDGRVEGRDGRVGGRGNDTQTFFFFFHQLKYAGSRGGTGVRRSAAAQRAAAASVGVQ